MQKQFQAVFALAGIAIAIVGLTNDQIPLLIVGFSLIFWRHWADFPAKDK